MLKVQSPKYWVQKYLMPKYSVPKYSVPKYLVPKHSVWKYIAQKYCTLVMSAILRSFSNGLKIIQPGLIKEFSEYFGCLPNLKYPYFKQQYTTQSVLWKRRPGHPPTLFFFLSWFYIVDSKKLPTKNHFCGCIHPKKVLPFPTIFLPWAWEGGCWVKGASKGSSD